MGMSVVVYVGVCVGRGARNLAVRSHCLGTLLKSYFGMGVLL